MLYVVDFNDVTKLSKVKTEINDFNDEITETLYWYCALKVRIPYLKLEFKQLLLNMRV